MMKSGYDFDAYVHSIARREPRRLPACLSVHPSVCLSDRPSVCLSVCLSACPCICHLLIYLVICDMLCLRVNMPASFCAVLCYVVCNAVSQAVLCYYDNSHYVVVCLIVKVSGGLVFTCNQQVVGLTPGHSTAK